MAATEAPRHKAELDCAETNCKYSLTKAYDPHSNANPRRQPHGQSRAL